MSKKIDLKNLEVQSFVTATNEAPIKGGLSLETFDAGCDTSPIICNIVTVNINCDTLLLGGC
jgi:hypothetical protein